MQINSTVKTIAVLTALSFFTTGCATILAPKNSSVVLFDAPKDLVVTENGNNVPLEKVLGDAKVRQGYSSTTTTYYYTSGIKLDRRHAHTLELISGDKKGTLVLKPRVSGGIVFADMMLTWGIGLPIDAITGKWKVLRRHNVDVPAVLNNTRMRSVHKLKKGLRRKLE